MMDELDARILSELSRNARLPITTLARRLGIARTTAQARLDRLEATGIIAGYSIKLGEDAQANRIRATVLLQYEPRKGPGIIQRLGKMPEVEALHTASGRFDMIIEMAAPTTARLDAILDAIGEIDGVRSSESLIHLSTKFDRSF